MTAVGMLESELFTLHAWAAEWLKLTVRNFARRDHRYDSVHVMDPRHPGPPPEGSTPVGFAVDGFGRAEDYDGRGIFLRMARVAADSGELKTFSLEGAGDINGILRVGGRTECDGCDWGYCAWSDLDPGQRAGLLEGRPLRLGDGRIVPDPGFHMEGMLEMARDATHKVIHMIQPWLPPRNR